MEQVDCVVEVDNSIDSNANFHRFISKLNLFYLFFTTVFSIMFIYLYKFCRIMSMFSNYSTSQYLAYLLEAPCLKSEVDAIPVDRIDSVECMLYRYM